jgi:hypothetical protein
MNPEKTDLQKEIDKLFIEPKIERECPVCRQQLYTAGRCKTCISCGWSICEN